MSRKWHSHHVTFLELNQANKQELGESNGEEENGKEKEKELTVQYGTYWH
jgi:hypothetical protein